LVSNVLNEEKKQQVVALGRLGWSLRRIEEATGVRRETASGYVKAAGIAMRPPGGWGRALAKVAEGAKPAKGVATGSEGEKPRELASEARASPTEPEPIRGATTSTCEPYRELIMAALAKGRNAMGIWQDLVDGHGFAGRYNSVKRFVTKLRGHAAPEARVAIETAPGEEAQVDYGTGPMVRDPATGKYRKTRLFVMTLGCSRKAVRLIVFKSSTQKWAELHEQAFRRLGGVTRVVVLDNLKEGVLTPDIYDPTINPLFRDVLKHYGAVALPCRVRDPDRKGKVESGVGHAQKTPLKGQRFESLEAAQKYLDHWEANWADKRIHGTTKRQVAAMFAEEKPALLPLPVEPFRYYKYGERTVHLDGCVEVEAAYYGAPPGWIGRKVQVQFNDSHVRLINPQDGQLLREHLRQARGRRRIEEQDQPAQTPLGTLKLLNRATTVGKNIGALARSLYEREGQGAVRRILGLLSLAKKYGAATCDEACEMGLETGSGHYHFVRKYLERRRASLGLRQIDPIIRQLTLYRDLIEQRGNPSANETTAKNQENAPL
jgi:transposase